MSKVDAALDLMRREPPSLIDATLSGVLDLAPECTEELLTSIDQPLKVMKDTQAHRDFLISDFNRDGDSYRSPWTSAYFPPNGELTQPAPALRELELDLHNTMEAYRDLYFDSSAIQSSYVWALPDGKPGFAACTLIKKEASNAEKGLTKGCWDSIHVFEVTPSESQLPRGVPGHAGMFQYKLTTTVMLTLSVGALSLSGNLTRQAKKEDVVVQASNHSHQAYRLDHIKNMGSLLEEQESSMRGALETLYFGKMKEIVAMLHSTVGVGELEKRRRLARMVVADVGGASPASLAAMAAARAGAH